MYLYDFLNLCNNYQMYNFSIKFELKKNLRLTFKYIELHFVTSLTLALRFVMTRLKSDVVH